MGSHQPIRKTVVTAAPVIPDKLYFRIGDVAKLCSVAAYVLRFWETEFPQLKPNKGGTGQRLYRRKDVEMALRIKSLLYEQGYTIPGARQALRSDGAALEAFSADSTQASKNTVILSEVSRPYLETQSKDPEGLRLASTSNPITTRNLKALHALRDELHSLAVKLALPVEGGEQAAKPKPMRPRLVLEAKPKAEPKLQIAKPKLDQGDLFGGE
jgi:DNA-binding transcriptional MerR regulator